MSRKVESWRVDQLQGLERKVWEAMQASAAPFVRPSEVAAAMKQRGANMTVEQTRRVLHGLTDMGFAQYKHGADEWAPAAVIQPKEKPKMSIVPQAQPERALSVVERLKKAETVLLDSIALLEEARHRIEELEQSSSDAPSADEIAQLRATAEKYRQLTSLLRE